MNPRTTVFLLALSSWAGMALLATTAHACQADCKPFTNFTHKTFRQDFNTSDQAKALSVTLPEPSCTRARGSNKELCSYAIAPGVNLMSMEEDDSTKVSSVGFVFDRKSPDAVDDIGKYATVVARFADPNFDEARIKLLLKQSLADAQERSPAQYAGGGIKLLGVKSGTGKIALFIFKQ